MSSALPPPNLGVREAKKRALMEHIQSAALDLFDERGYDAVAIEDVAAAAGVSPSTVYRNFGTKHRLVTHDEFDRELVALLLAAYPAKQPIAAARSVVEGFRVIFTGASAREHARRIGYMMDVPAVYAAMCLELRDTADYLASELLARSDERVSPLDARMVANMLCDALVVAARTWRDSEFTVDVADVMGECLDVLERGLALGVRKES